jgi:hypothetical protein
VSGRPWAGSIPLPTGPPGHELRYWTIVDRNEENFLTRRTSVSGLEL